MPADPTLISKVWSWSTQSEVGPHSPVAGMSFLQGLVRTSTKDAMTVHISRTALPPSSHCANPATLPRHCNNAGNKDPEEQIL
uniref:Uncharacterized protein n=1 Tax=Pyxicephalus adspersus TaxID=30357 RepID=A0AAV2ZMJ5_PYXAD|nr:TPA: hypothetical protein GDO54_015190 [Pyxicephalus adspersus]